ncbi:MAG: SDR family oxidoreductase [Planctomycetota bacterium]
MIELTNKVALVTGGSRGIGRACARRLAEAGAHLIVNYVTSRAAATELGEELRALGRDVAVVKADVTERDDVDSLVDFIRREFGRLDIVVSNAATGGFRPLMATTDANFAAAMNTNTRPVLYLVQAALDLLADRQERTKVIALSSHGSHLALPMYGTIGATKAALESLMRHLALELGGRGINFNIVKAGLVETDSTRRLPGADAMFAGRQRRGLVGDRVLEATDVADAVLFLASRLSDLVQGETLTIDGGMALHA